MFTQQEPVGETGLAVAHFSRGGSDIVTYYTGRGT